MLSRQIQITIHFREGCTSSRVTSWRTGRRIAVRVAEHHGVIPRNVEFVSREKSRAAASRVGDAPTGRALKRARFAVGRDDNNAEMLEPTSEPRKKRRTLPLRIVFLMRRISPGYCLEMRR